MQEMDKVKNVRMLTTDPQMWDFMEYEIFHFNTTPEIHLEVIEMNIQKIKKTSNTFDLLPLTPYLKITEQFQIVLEHLDALHHEASDDPEMNCYICRNDYENGDQVLICKTRTTKKSKTSATSSQRGRLTTQPPIGTTPPPRSPVRRTTKKSKTSATSSQRQRPTTQAVEQKKKTIS
ncbi:hypothetical protein CAEBREN_14830 [Caenorhabditis brenneri]|uniref:Uncharacterized protein n=1 Tax=Caenorhabditis brenneri TaxID=135651 RepID=G0P453_CAEBE|nr:hypothetical protein CAEBREN_14830 [Caenorhabditis brenneri]